MFSASMCLAMAIYFESAVEPSYNAGLAVAEVILNRVRNIKVVLKKSFMHGLLELAARRFLQKVRFDQ